MRENITQTAMKNIRERRRIAEAAAAHFNAVLENDLDWQAARLDSNAENLALALALRQKNKKAENAARKNLESLNAERGKILARHGIAEAQLAPKYRCRTCSDTGYYNQEFCVCVHKEIRALLASGGGCGGLIIDQSATFKMSADKKNKDVYNYCKDYCDKFVTGVPEILNILISGETGTGKTFLANCMANRFLSGGKDVLMLNVFTLADIFLKQHISALHERLELFESLAAVEVLIIDDLGSEPQYNNVTEASLLRLLIERGNARLATVITTNCSPNDILRVYKERIFSRMFDKRTTRAFLLESEGGADARLGIKLK